MSGSLLAGARLSPSSAVQVPDASLAADLVTQSGTALVTLTATIVGDYTTAEVALVRYDKNGAVQTAPTLGGSDPTWTFTPSARGEVYVATLTVTYAGGEVEAKALAFTTPTATMVWTTVADFDFSLEANQSPSSNQLTVTNRVDSSSVVFDVANGVAITGGKLVFTTAAGAQLAVTTASTDTAPRFDALLTTIWPAFGGESLCWASGVATAPTFTENGEAWGVFQSGPVRLGGGALGWGYTAESRHNGTNSVRSSRWQSGSTSVNALSTASFATTVCAIKSDGIRPMGSFSTTAADIATPELITALGPVGSYGANSGGSPIGTPGIRLGAFACAGASAGPNAEVSRLILRALRPAVS